MSDKKELNKKLIALGAVGLAAVAAGALVNDQQKEDVKAKPDPKPDVAEEVNEVKQAVKQEKANVSAMAGETANQTAQQAAEKKASEEAQAAAKAEQGGEVVASAGDGGQTYVGDQGGYTGGQSGYVGDQGGYVGGQGGYTAQTPQFPQGDPYKGDLYQQGKWTDQAAEEALANPDNWVDMGDGTKRYIGDSGTGITTFSH